MKDISQKNERVIQLDELPHDGLDYLYTSESGELNEALNDLLAGRPYRLEFYLRPAGNSYELRGTVRAAMPLLCSRCAIDFEHQIEETFYEILIVNPPLDRKSKTSQTNHLTDSQAGGTFCNYIQSEEFDVGDWAHEIIALAEPAQPLGRPNCDESCENYLQAVKNGWLTQEEDSPASPFAVLANVKVPPVQ